MQPERVPVLANSPFIDGTKIQFAWDSTSLGWLKDCPRKYFYHQIEGWRSKAESVSLTFGLLYHKALELRDRQLAEGVPTDVALRNIIRITLQSSYGWNSDSTSKNRETLIRSIVWYVDEFASDPLETVILESGKPAVELSFRMNLDWGPKGYNITYILSGHPDRIVNFSGGRYVTDRKTTGSTIGTDYFARFDLDNQMSLYTIAANVVFHTPVKGIIIDGAQIAVGFTRFARGLTYRTPAQTEEWLHDLHYWLRQAETFAESGHYPMNERSCMLCSFKKVCSKDPAVRQQFLESDFERRPWNPLEVRT